MSTAIPIFIVLLAVYVAGMVLVNWVSSRDERVKSKPEQKPR